MTNNVFITGGSRGIGAAAVLAFARAGYNVAFTYNSHPDAADAVRRQAEEINPGGLYLAIRADAGDPAQVRAAVARAEQELGSLQVLVCNAGIAQVKLFTSTSFGSGAPGGIFMPILAVGSLAGGICGETLRQFGNLPSDSVAIFAVCVMTGTLAASVKTATWRILRRRLHSR